MPAYLVLYAGTRTKADLVAGSMMTLESGRIVAADEQAAMTQAATTQGRGGRFAVVPMSAVTIGSVPESRTFATPIVE